MGNLQIYSASAGSGKTFQLAKTYIRLLYSHPTAYRNILAVTFTNKAAGEMKERILNNLFLMSTLEDEKDITPFLMQNFNLSREDIRKRSAKLLSSILHNYSYFSIQTIDSFFQNILRTFIRELRLPYNYSLEMNQDRVLNEVVNLFLQSAGNKTDLKNWLVQFAEAKINAGETWNFKGEILQLGKEFFNERGKISFFHIRDKIKDRNLLKEYRNELRDIKATFENRMVAFGNNGIDLMKKYGFEVDDFNHKSAGPGAYFVKLADKSKFDPNSYVRAATEKSEVWFSKSSPHQVNSLGIIEMELMPLLVNTVQFYKHKVPAYNTAKHILKQFYNLGIAFELSEELQRYTQDNNSFLMADMGPFLSRITGNNDAPFIYEKTGTYYHHFMLDESQDTSVIQWNNFKPLISNSLAQGYSNLIVGDVKQSIYRWRNSDWKIMENQIDRDFDGFNMNRDPLPNNFRSRERVVRFNNDLFSTAPEVLQSWFNEDFEPGLFEEEETGKMQHKILDIYDSPVQNVARHQHAEGGFTKVNFQGKSTFHEAASYAFTRDIGMLLHAGVAPASIAVLVRTGKDGARAIRALLEYKDQEPDLPDFGVLSADSLYLQNAPSVRFLIALLSYLDDPNNALNLAHLYFESRFINNQSLNLNDRSKDFEKLFSDTLFSEVTKKELFALRRHSLIEIVEKAVEIFNVGNSRNEIPYIQGFLDVVLNYTRDKSGEIHSFLEWWKIDGVKESLPSGSNTDAIQVLTIHKAKGLQFEYVFIPFTDWSMDHQQNPPVLWCNIPNEPFNRIAPIPVKYSKELRNSYFASFYMEEQLSTFIDNLNLLYVAFTRAISGLYIYAPSGDNKKNVSGLLLSSLDIMIKQNVPLPSEGWKEKDKLWIYGSPSIIEVPEEKHGQAPESITLETYNSWPYASRMRLKYQGEDYFSNDKQNKINRGTLLHKIFEKIITMEDLEDALIQINEEGKIDRDELNKLRKHIKKLILEPKVSEWFDGSWKVKTEAEFIIPGGGTLRPDRVMFKDGQVWVVDYKFGEIKNESHHRQVRRYKKSLLDMGYSRVKACLWYAELGVVEEVA